MAVYRVQQRFDLADLGRVLALGDVLAQPLLRLAVRTGGGFLKTWKGKANQVLFGRTGFREIGQSVELLAGDNGIQRAAAKGFARLGA